jgi:hypothetical protein
MVKPKQGGRGTKGGSQGRTEEGRGRCRGQLVLVGSLPGGFPLLLLLLLLLLSWSPCVHRSHPLSFLPGHTG